MCGGGGTGGGRGAQRSLSWNVARNQGAGKMLRVDLFRMLNAMLNAYLQRESSSRPQPPAAGVPAAHARHALERSVPHGMRRMLRSASMLMHPKRSG